MQIHQVKREHPNKRGKIIGRGGKRGTTSGKGTKGQLARSGRKLRPELREIIKKIPKLRGYRFTSIQKDTFPVNLDILESNFSAGSVISPKTLIASGIVERFGGKKPFIKILGKGKITKKFIINGCEVSETAKAEILKAGGEIK